MNKKIKSFIWLTPFFMTSAFCGQPLAATESSQAVSQEIERIEDLIDVSKQNVSVLTQLKASIEKYQLLQSRYMQNQDNNDLLYQMIKEAYSILETIKKYQLASLFDPAFISELTLVSKPAAKLGLPKP
jgi:hypothetical protein